MGPPRILTGMTKQPASGGDSRLLLTVGELFPHGDMVAQWVYSLTTLAEDRQVGVRPTREAMDSGDRRALLFWHRHLVTRLYEARRLVTSANNITDVGEFLGDLPHKPPRGANLVEAYTRSTPHTPSMVEAQYGTRHTQTGAGGNGASRFTSPVRLAVALRADMLQQTRALDGKSFQIGQGIRTVGTVVRRKMRLVGLAIGLGSAASRDRCLRAAPNWRELPEAVGILNDGLL